MRLAACRALSLFGRQLMSDLIFERIEQELSSNSVVLFMKGTANFPQCGFSATVAQVLQHLGIEFKGINVLEDMDIREGIKKFSNWPTVPQLYVNGEFVGGCDIIKEMFESGELQSLFERTQSSANSVSGIAS